MDNSSLQRKMVAAKKCRKVRYSRKLSWRHRERLFELLSSDEITRHWSRGATLSNTYIRTVLRNSPYIERRYVCRYRKYVLFNPKEHRVERVVSAGEMAYSRQSAVRFSAAKRKGSKELSRYDWIAKTADNLERLRIHIGTREKCPHKPRYLLGHYGHFTFYCQYCGCAWRDICAYRRLHNSATGILYPLFVYRSIRA